jgi:hypothetical protein
MQESTINKLNERMKDLLEFYSPAIEERWEARGGYEIMGSLSWIEVGSNVITQIQNAAVALCTEEDMSVNWIPDWIQVIKDTALNGGNNDNIKTIIKNWKNYYS